MQKREQERAAHGNRERGSYTLNEWLEHRRLSRSMYYKLDQAGRAPDSYLVGNCRYITREADQAWLAERQAEKPRNSPGWAKRQAESKAA